MRSRTKRHPGLLPLSLAAVLLLVTTVHAAATPVQKCEKAKLKAAGKSTARTMVGCWGKAKAKGLPVSPTCLSNVQAREDAAINEAGGACLGTASAIDTAVDNCVGALLDADPFTGNCGAGSAKVEGKAVGRLVSCTVRYQAAPNPPSLFPVCDTTIDGWLGGALGGVGGCVAPAAVLPVLDSCTRSLASLIGVCPLATTWGTPDQGVAVDANGNVFVVDGSVSIQKFDNGGTFISMWSSPSNGSPVGVAVDANGNVFVADADNDGHIQEFDNGGTFITAWEAPDPVGVAVDPSGNVFVAELDGRIQKFDNSGTLIAAWGTPGNGPGQFNLPVGVAVDASGNVFVADTGNDRIQKFDDGGTFVSAWGTPSPGGLAVDASGNVFVADELDDRIQKFDNSGAFITAWGVPQSFAGSCCPARSGVAVDASGNVFVAGDSGILKFACS